MIDPEKLLHPEEDEEEDDPYCDLDSTKLCDNCMKCVIGDSDYRSIAISGITLAQEGE